MHRLSSALHISYQVLGIHEFTILSGLDTFSGIHLIKHYWKCNFFKKQAWKKGQFCERIIFGRYCASPPFLLQGRRVKRSALHQISCHCTFFCIKSESFSAIFSIACSKRTTVPYLRGGLIFGKCRQFFDIFFIWGVFFFVWFLNLLIESKKILF